MTDLEKLIADELRRIDPQESGVETKAIHLSRMIVHFFIGYFGTVMTGWDKEGRGQILRHLDDLLH